MILWGKQNGKQRFKCKGCGLLFTRQNKEVSLSNQFVWFRKWVLNRQTLSYISDESGYSIRTLKRLFARYLDRAPTLKFFPRERLNLLIDATYFSNDICLVIYRDNQVKFTQLYRLTDGEYYHEIKEDLEVMLSLGITIESITCDGHRSILKAVRKTCKEVMLQRCLVHIQRECKIWLTQNPKSEAGLSLLAIVKRLSQIRTHHEAQHWMREIVDWHTHYQTFVQEKSYSKTTGRYWYKHKLVRRCFIMIKNALPNMFQYLFNDHVPKSTNGLESFFGHLKSHLLLHRGMTKEHRKSFIKWYIYFRNNE